MELPGAVVLGELPMLVDVVLPGDVPGEDWPPGAEPVAGDVPGGDCHPGDGPDAGDVPGGD